MVTRGRVATSGEAHLSIEIDSALATPRSVTCMPRGTGAKLIEKPWPPVPRPTRSSKLRRTAALTDEFVRGGGTESVPTFS